MLKIRRGHRAARGEMITKAKNATENWNSHANCGVKGCRTIILEKLLAARRMAGKL